MAISTRRIRTECKPHVPDRVTVIVDDRAGGSDATRCEYRSRPTRSEAPSTPARPTVRAKEKSSTSLVVSMERAREHRSLPSPATTWSTARAADSFSDDGVVVTRRHRHDNCGDQGITGTSTTITMLDDDTTYEVRIKAKNRRARQRPIGNRYGADQQGQPRADFRRQTGHRRRQRPEQRRWLHRVADHR